MLGKMKELMEAQRKLQDMKRELEQLEVRHAVWQDNISVTMNGTQRILDIRIAPDVLAPQHQAAVQRELAVCINAAADKVQREVAVKFKSRLGDMNIPGL